MTRGPLRLRDDPSQPDELRELLADADSAPPTLDSATKAASIASVLAGAGAASASTVAASGVTATGVKLWLLAGGLCVGGVVAGIAWSPADELTTRQQPSAALAPPARAAAPTAALEPEAPVESPAAERPAAEPPARARPAPGRARPREAARPPSADTLRAEAALLENARAHLESDPGAALRATRRHAIAHPEGQLESERELIAIEALLRLGRTARADRRARAFLRARPSGIYADRVRGLLARAETEPEEGTEH